MHECSLWYARNDFVACRMLKVFGMVRYQKKKKTSHASIKSTHIYKNI